MSNTPSSPSAAPSAAHPGHSASARGWLYGASAYLIWTAFPLYFALLDGEGAIEVIVHRAFWGLVMCVLLLLFMGRISQVRDLLRRPSITLRLLAAGVLVVVNWTVYVYAVMNGHVVDAAFGYFINPIVTVLLGVLVLHERLNPWEKTAVSLGVVSVIYLLVTLHIVPWISLVLAFSFGTYSLVKKAVASQVPVLAGMAIETSAMVPILLVYYLVLGVHGRTSLQQMANTGQPWLGHLLLLIGSGVLTVVPLVLFAHASRTLSLGSLGLLQYINPVGQTLIGVYVMGEHMPTERWVATAIVSLALVILSVGAVRSVQGRRRSADSSPAGRSPAEGSSAEGSSAEG